jgi:solute carrier family 25 oxoglutarate transporter 11
MPEKKGGIATIAEPFVCGGSAATFASVIIHPMDLAKASNNIWHIRCSGYSFR